MLIGATSFAFLFAVRRKIACIASGLRAVMPSRWSSLPDALFLGITGWEALGVEIVQAVIWSCLALSVVLADVGIHWKEIRSTLSIPVRSGSPRSEKVPERAVAAT